MASANFNRQLVIGTVTVERLERFAIPALLRPHVAALAKAHAALEKEARRAGVARTARAAGSGAIAEADAALGESVEQLAGALVVAGLAPLRAPFAAYGGKAVSYYTRGSRVRVAKEIGALVVAIRATDPPPLVKQKLAACARHCAAVMAAYATLGAKRVDFRMARGAREAAFDAFVAAYSDVKHIARVAWRGEPETFGIVFGEIEADRFGTRVARKRVTASVPSTTNATGTTPGHWRAFRAAAALPESPRVRLVRMTSASTSILPMDLAGRTPLVARLQRDSPH